jgi:hypothetical protein
MSKIVQSLVDFSQRLENSKNKLESYLNDRKGSLQKFATELVSEGGYFNQNAPADLASLIDQYKVRLDPRLVPPKTFDPNFDGVGAQTTIVPSDDLFTQLGVMDVWNATLQAKALNGIIGSKIPLLPMVFRVELPPTAERNKSVPNLTLFINPSSWNRSISKVQQNQWTRKGVKTERWGDDLEQIQAKGEIGGFYTLQTGLTRFHRWQTPTYRNLMELVQIYKNNGCTYGKTYSNNPDFVAPSQNRILDIGYVEILYGYEVFIGNFESFEISESDDRPFSLSYSFTFNCANVISIHDLNPSTSKQLSQPRQSSSVNLVPGYTIRADYNDNVSAEVTAVEAAMKAAGEINDTNGTNSLFTPPNKTISNSPKDTLFPSLLSGLGKSDPSKPFVFNASGQPDTRGAIKVDFRDDEESRLFYQNLPQDPKEKSEYIQNFLDKQKTRTNGG